MSGSSTLSCGSSGFSCRSSSLGCGSGFLGCRSSGLSCGLSNCFLSYGGGLSGRFLFLVASNNAGACKQREESQGNDFLY
ncbi:MAG: hypothetical protein OEV73_05455 [Desulfobulbaceae bacterium]|nr:hypothetical protein [Desulfobulbaceae bacterium]